MGLRVLGIVVLAITALVVRHGARIGLAQRLVFTDDVPGFELGASPERLQRAAALTPREGALALWTARQSYLRYRTGWLSAEAPQLGEDAARDATLAVRSRPADPDAHLLAAAVALDRARHVRTAAEPRAALQAEARTHLATALALWPVSSAVGGDVAVLLVPAWPSLATQDRDIGRTGFLRLGSDGDARTRRRFAQMLESLSDVLGQSSVSPGEHIRILEEVTPDVRPALLTLAGRCRDLAGGRAGEVATELQREARRCGVHTLERAAIATSFELRIARDWLESWLRDLPEQRGEALEAFRRAADDHPQWSGAWLARALAAEQDGNTGAARDAAEQARRIAHAELAELVPEPALDSRALLAQSTSLSEQWDLWKRQEIELRRARLEEALAVLDSLAGAGAP